MKPAGVSKSMPAEPYVMSKEATAFPECFMHRLTQAWPAKNSIISNFWASQQGGWPRLSHWCAHEPFIWGHQILLTFCGSMVTSWQQFMIDLHWSLHVLVCYRWYQVKIETCFPNQVGYCIHMYPNNCRQYQTKTHTKPLTWLPKSIVYEHALVYVVHMDWLASSNTWTSGLRHSKIVQAKSTCRQPS